MIEYRTERIFPQYQDSVTELLGVFGWSIVSSQEIYNESTDIVGVDVKIYGDGFIGGFMQGFTGSSGTVNVRQRKNISNYVVLNFARDTDMPNYARLRELNAEFESIMNAEEPKKPVKRTAVTVVGTLIIAVSIIMALINGTSALLWEIIVCVLFPLITVPLTAVGWVKYKRRMRDYNYILSRMDEIYNEAQLLNS